MPKLYFDSDVDVDDTDSENETFRVINDIPWIEKYRPQNLDSIVFQDEIIRVLKNSIKTGNLPHLLLHGPAGTGKTSTILAAARELFGPTIYRDRVIELNASDERGINIVRKKIVDFAKLSIGSIDPKYPSPNYKIIILDEADAMTKEAQGALRKVMEEYSGITRFCFICNYINQIIEPINSRCVKFRFRQLNNISISNKLEQIAFYEKISVLSGAIDVIINSSEGDLRKAIMLLQNLKYIVNFEEPAVGVDLATVTDMVGVLPPKMINKICKVCLSVESTHANIIEITDKIIKRGFPIQNILNNVINLIITSKNISDQQKSLMSIKMLQSEYMISQGSNEYIQLLNIFMQIKKLLTSVN